MSQGSLPDWKTKTIREASGVRLAWAQATGKQLGVRVGRTADKQAACWMACQEGCLFNLCAAAKGFPRGVLSKLVKFGGKAFAKTPRTTKLIPSLNIPKVLATHKARLPFLPLCQLPAGGRGFVRELTGDAHFCQRVREMGFGESTRVTKIAGRNTIICQVNDTRIALSHDAARNILVEQIVKF